MTLRCDTGEATQLALMFGVGVVLCGASACGQEANAEARALAPLASAVVAVQQDSVRLAEALGAAALDGPAEDNEETPQVQALPLDAESLASLLSTKVPGYQVGPTKSGTRETRGAMTSFVERTYRGKGQRRFTLQLHDLSARLGARDFEIPVAGVEGTKVPDGLTVGEVDGLPFQWRIDARGRRGELRLWLQGRFLFVLKSDRLSQSQASVAALASLNRKTIAEIAM